MGLAPEVRFYHAEVSLVSDVGAVVVELMDIRAHYRCSRIVWVEAGVELLGQKHRQVLGHDVLGNPV